MEEAKEKSATIANLLNKLPSPSLLFRVWAQEAFQKGHLEVIIDAVIKSGAAENEKSAIEYLAEKVTSFSPRDGLLTSSDLWGPSRQRELVSNLRKILECEKSHCLAISR